MRSRVTPSGLALFCVIALAVGCSSHNKDKLENTKWESKETTLKSGVVLPDRARVIEFKSDETLNYELNPDDKENARTLTGKWKLNSGDFVTLTFDQTLNDRKVHVEKIVVKDDALTMTDSDGTTVTFTRWKPKVKPPE